MINTTIAHYKVTSKLGQGGMGEVYRATDTKLDREVAIKVLPEEFAKHPERLARFEREAKALAKLNHPNIGSIYGFDQHEGLWFLVLELIEGEDLSERLKKGPLPVEEALKVFQQIAGALEAAHEKGIIHRDLKPGNIKVDSQGRVKVLDFGLAKARLSSGESVDSNASTADSMAPTITNEFTMPGKVMGTAAYMSPEQSRGQEVDKRTDVWAFGCCLYEALTGRRPFKGATTSDLLAEILKSDPDFTVIPPETPSEVMTLLRRCLEKEPRRRLRDLGDIAITLEETSSPSRTGAYLAPPTTTGITTKTTQSETPPRNWVWPAAVVVLGAALLVTGYFLWHGAKAPVTQANSIASNASTNEAPKTLAVLPFVNLSADKSDEYLSLRDGMADELINALGGVPGLRVPGRSSSFAFKDLSEENLFKKVGDQLKVSTVLEGSVRKAGDQLRIIARLVNVADGFQLWSETYDRPMTNILALQGEIATRVAEALKVRLGVEEARALTKTENPEAHRLYLLGRYHFGKATQTGWSDAIQAFNQAIQMDPNYALAYCGLADNYGFLGGTFMPGKEAWAREKDAAQAAVALDPNLADAHLSLALALATDYDWLGAERAVKRALELNPNLALAHDQYAWILSLLGRFDEATARSKAAVELDPLSPLMHLNRGYWLYLARRFDEAVVHCRKALELDPNSPWALRTLGWSLLWKGDKAGALASMEKAQSLDADPFSIGSFGYALAASGDRAKAEQILHDLENLAQQRYVSPAASMVVYLGLGEKEKALEWLEKNYADRDPTCWPLKVEPFYDSLRTEPRFQAVLKKVFPEP